MDKIREALAALEHDRWARWQKYLHSKCAAIRDGYGNVSLVIPAKSVEHWQRQIDTPYAELSEREKDSDRKEAHNTMQLLTDFGVLLDRPLQTAKKALLQLVSEMWAIREPENVFDTQRCIDVVEAFGQEARREALREAGKRVIEHHIHGKNKTTAGYYTAATGREVMGVDIRKARKALQQTTEEENRHG